MGKLEGKETKLVETQVSLQSPEMLGKLRTQKKTRIFLCGKFYLSYRASAFGNPLVRD